MIGIIGSHFALDKKPTKTQNSANLSKLSEVRLSHTYIWCHMTSCTHNMEGKKIQSNLGFVSRTQESGAHRLSRILHMLHA